MITVLVAFLLTIPTLGYQATLEADPHPANLVFSAHFDGLDQLQPSTVLTLTDEDGTAQDFAVVWSHLYPVDELPPEVWDGPASGGTVVTLIDLNQTGDESPMQRVVRAGAQ